MHSEKNKMLMLWMMRAIMARETDPEEKLNQAQKFNLAKKKKK